VKLGKSSELDDLGDLAAFILRLFASGLLNHFPVFRLLLSFITIFEPGVIFTYTSCAR